jgi:predicted ATP-dependent endonuclease of OLD family
MTAQRGAAKLLSDQVVQAYRRNQADLSDYENLSTHEIEVPVNEDLLSTVVPGADYRGLENRKSSSNKEELSRLANIVKRSTRALEDVFIYEYGARNRTETLHWIIACHILADAPSHGSRIEIAKRIVEKRWDGFKNNEVGKTFSSLFPVLSRLISKLVRMDSSKFEADRSGASIKVSIRSLLNSKYVDEDLEILHKNGYLNLGFDKISSGEAAILHQLTSISRAVRKQSLRGIKEIVVFIDEADMLLHLRWQRKYIELLDIRLALLKKSLGLASVQVIIATHSPILATEIFHDSITRLGKRGETPSFGATLQKIINYSFDTPTIGSLVEKKIRVLKKRKKFSPHDLAIINQIDDEFTKRYLLSGGVL